MAETVADYIIDRLHSWGVKRIFGYSGDGIGGLMGALSRAEDKMSFVQVRHEEVAGLMACAHAKFTGEVGVCIATQGPGAIHLLNGLYDAKMDHQPVVAIIGQVSRKAMGGHYQQEVDLISLFKDVAGDFIQMATDASQVRHLVDRAVRIAKVERTVTCVIVPNDVQELEYSEPAREHFTLHSGIGVPVPTIIPREEDLQKAAEVLNAGSKVAILIGAGAFGAKEEVMKIAELLGAGVAKALLGKAALPDDLPYVTGPIGFFGSLPSHEMMNKCDTLLVIGSSFPYAEFLPKEGQARGVQIDIDGKMLSMRYPMEVNLMGDSKDTLQALIPLLKQKEDQSWRLVLEEMIKDWWKELGEQANTPAKPLNPRLVFRELSPRIPDNCILAADSGSTTSWFSQYLQLRDGMMASVSGTLATMGCAIPYALAAKFAYPERPVIAVIGDGAMQMSGNDELITVKKYWQRWSNPFLIVLVLNNRDLNMVTWEQRLMQGNPKFDASQDIPDFPYAQYAESLGLMGIKIDSPDQVKEAWDKALKADRPVVIEAVTDPEVFMFTSHINQKYVEKLTEAIKKGDTAAGENLESPLKEKVEEKVEVKE